MTQRGPRFSQECEPPLEGMQDASLLVPKNHPIWSQIEVERRQRAQAQAKTDHANGCLEIDTDNLPELLNSRHSKAPEVLQALYRLGVYN
jgi:hypothetical protein